MLTASSYALAACVEYDTAMRTIARCTSEIGAVVCPLDETTLGHELGEPTRSSCFGEARKIQVPRSWDPGDGPRNLNLDEIATLVADCPDCSRLCVLIRERKDARKAWGVAKRKIRAAAKRAPRLMS